MKKGDRIRVLVLDADMVPALTISRSLKRQNCIVDVASHEPRPVTAYSNSISQVFQYPNPLSEGKSFLEWLVGHTRAIYYDLVIPVTERSLVSVSNNRDLFDHVRIAMPTAESLEVALDKVKTMQLAERVGVPTPRGERLDSLDQLSSYAQTLGFPVVLKPARSLGSNAQGSRQLKVSYAFDHGELLAGCEHALKFGPVLLQELFKGVGVGIELIARRGQIVYAFQHRRLHEVPLSGGGSSLRVSEAIEPALLDAAQRLVGAMEWNGVAMVEFKFNPETSAFSLMEINGRFWGSLPLANAAGADFPSMLLGLMLDDHVTPCGPYKPGTYCRKLSSDLYWYEAVMRRGPESRVADIPGGWSIFKELGLFFLPRHYFDVQSFRDPKPGLIDIRGILQSYYHRLLGVVSESWFFWRQRIAWRRGEVDTAVSNAQNILFICYGNINRSALANEAIRGYAEDLGVSVVSAGFHPETGRSADPVMTQIAGDLGVDMHRIRSAVVTREMTRQSDVIFVMEKAHYDRLKLVDSETANKTYLLGAHEGPGKSGSEIADPFGQPRERYEYCFHQIAEAVDNIKGALVSRQAL